MTTKKKKSLALELVDELLDEIPEAAIDSELISESEQAAESPDDATEVIDIQAFELDSPPVPASEAESTQNHMTGRAYPEEASPLEVSLAQSQNLSLAQDKILELEEEINILRIENEELAAAGETFKEKSDDLFSKLEISEKRAKEELAIYKEEKEILLAALKERGKAMDQMTSEKEQLEIRIKKNINRVRVHERELENRLELIKLENIALARTKDEVILDLKKQVDHLVSELENDRSRARALNDKLDDQHEVLHRTVKALRIALTMLEGNGTATKKAS